MTKRLVILGAPGAGKGTQAKNICEYLGIPTFSTGAMLRSHMQAKTELGEMAQQYTTRGELVPDSVINPMVAQTIAEEKFADGFLADGYPRSVAQAEYFNTVLRKLDVELDMVLNIEINLESVVSRLIKRAEIEHRADDTEPVIRHRLEVYQSTTKPLVDWYDASGLLVSVDGDGTVAEVWQAIKAVL